MSNPDNTFFFFFDHDKQIQWDSGVRVPGIYKFILTVKEDTVSSLPDTVVVTVHDRDNPPFEDYGLELSLRKELNIPSRDLTLEEIASVDSLNYYIKFGKLTNLTGIEKMPELHYLSLGFNNLTDISPLAGLKKLRDLRIVENPILQDISPLVDLTELTLLDISKNYITDISPLENLVNIETLNLSFNKISDINPLQNMIKLNALYLAGNAIIDISPLVRNPGIGEGDYVWLARNPLSETSINELIPALRARGVNIAF